MRTFSPSSHVALILALILAAPAAAQDSVLTRDQIESLEAQLDGAEDRPEVGTEGEDLWEEYQRYRDKGELRRSGERVKVGDSVVVQEDERVGGDVVSVGGRVTVYGYVEGDVVAVGGDVILHEGAEVDGDVVSVGGRVREEGDVTVHGEKVSVNIPFPGNWDWTFNFGPSGAEERIFTSGWSLIILVVGLLLTFLFYAIGGHRTDVIARRVEEEPGQSFLIGILGALGTPLAALIASVLLAITIIGLLLLPVLAILIWVLWFGGLVAVSLAVGRRLAQARDRDDSLVTRSPYFYLLLGYLALSAFGILGSVFSLIGGGFFGPMSLLFDVLDACVILFASMLGYGGLLLSRLGTQLPGGQPAFVPAGSAAAAAGGFSTPPPPPPGASDQPPPLPEDLPPVPEDEPKPPEDPPPPPDPDRKD